MIFQKKPYVKFSNLIPGVEKVHPIVPASSVKFDWVKKINNSIIEKNKTLPIQEQKGNTAQCPGIFDIMKQGFIVTAPFDVVIKTFGDKNNFEWQMNIDPAKLSAQVNRPYISAHSADQLKDFTLQRKDSLDIIIKLNTYWSIFSNKDLIFLQMPIPYPDNNNFSVCHGIIDTRKYCDLILQLQWHCLNDAILIKAGTPLCQLIPLHKNLNVDLIVETMSDSDLYKSKAYGYLTMHRFTKNWKEWRKKAADILG